MDWSRASAAPVIHARRTANVAALCGAPPGTPFTTARGHVTCKRYRAIIAERLAARAGDRK